MPLAINNMTSLTHAFTHLDYPKKNPAERGFHL